MSIFRTYHSVFPQTSTGCADSEPIIPCWALCTYVNLLAFMVSQPNCDGWMAPDEFSSQMPKRPATKLPARIANYPKSACNLTSNMYCGAAFPTLAFCIRVIEMITLDLDYGAPYRDASMFHTRGLLSRRDREMAIWPTSVHGRQSKVTTSGLRHPPY